MLNYSKDPAMSTKFVLYSLALIAIALLFVSGFHNALEANVPVKTKETPPEEAGKNIQVLKGISEAHREKVMDFMTTSLGVKCNHCHVIDTSGWHMDLDDKPAKRTARKMMQMVMDLNSKTFSGRNDVTCYTCHRGSILPAATLSLPIPPQAPPKKEEVAAPPSLPTIEQVLAMYEKALGGDDAMKKITSRVSKGVAIDGQGREMPMELVSQVPDKFLSSMTMREGAQSVRGFDGTTGWMSSPRGSRKMSPDESEDMKINGLLFSIARIKALSKTLHVSRKDTANGASVIVISASASDHVTESYYIDAESGLLLRKLISTETMIADIPEQVDYFDYRNVDGVKVPFVIRSASADPRDAMTRTITSVEQNVKIDEKKFEMPTTKK